MDNGHQVLVNELAVHQRARAIRAALGHLKPSERDVLVLRFVADLSHREIAETLKSPLGTVKTRIRKGLSRLRALLRELDGRRE